MPYIERLQRPELDRLVQPLIDHLKGLPLEAQDGALNYVVTKILRQLYPARYFHYNRALGVLTAITHEYYRRVVAPYEDTKVQQHGDVE